MQNLEFIQSLTEARLYRYDQDFSSKSASDIALTVYAMFLMLEVMRRYDSDFAIKYAKDTFTYGDFSSVRSYATDLHNLLAGLDQKLPRSDVFLTIPEFGIKRHLREIMYGQRTIQLTRQFYLQLEQDLAIQNSALKSVRRNIVDYINLSQAEYLDSAERLHRLLLSLAPYADLHWRYKSAVRDKLLLK
jgi:hypothetical protein